MSLVGSALQNEPALRQRRAAQQRVQHDGAELDVSVLPSFGFGHRSLTAFQIFRSTTQDPNA